MPFILILLAAKTLVFADGLTVVKDGRSDYLIVIPTKAIESEKFAAEELALHIKKMSGADLKIISDASPLPKQAILLGNTRHLDKLGVKPDWSYLGKEGYLFRTVGNHLVIAGGRPRGTMYGVYDLLQKHWNCQWFTFDVSSIPESPTLSVPDLDRTYRPVFEFRDIGVMAYPNCSHGEWFYDNIDLDYLARMRNSGRWLEESLYQSIGKKYGGVFRIHSLHHNWHLLLPLKEHAEKHPEYFALLEDGTRKNYGDKHTGEIQLCLSNPDVAHVVAETLRGWMRENPDADVFFVGPSDKPGFCACDSCHELRKEYGGWDSARRVEIPKNLPDDYLEGSYWDEYGGYAGWNLHFVNHIAKLLEDEFPYKTIGTLAYWYYRRPPRNITAHKNVMIMYCPLRSGWLGKHPILNQRCYCHPVNGGPINAGFENFDAELFAWRDIADHAYIFDYWLGGWQAQPANISTLSDTIRFYRSAGAEGLFLCQIAGLPGGFEWLIFWLWSQLLWDPDFDVDKGIDDFCKAYYGTAAPYIKQYIELTSDPQNYTMASRQDVYVPGTILDFDRTKRFTDDPYTPISLDSLRDCQLADRDLTIAAVNQGYELFEEARKAVADDPKIAKHVEYTRTPLQYAMAEFLPRTDPRLQEEVPLFGKLAKELGIEYLGHQGLGYDDYALKKLYQDAEQAK